MIDTAGPEPGRQEVVAAFDVDGTLTVSDCVGPFLERLAGRAGLLRGVARRPRSLADAAIRLDRDRLKAVVVRAAYRGRDVSSVEELGTAFADTIRDTLLRRDTADRLRWHLEQRHRVVLVSASLGSYLRPLGHLLGVEAVLCTEVAVGGDGRYSGELVGGNCRGPEKQRRLRAWMMEQGVDEAEVWAYGDSRGDRELLLGADHPLMVKGILVTSSPVPPRPGGPLPGERA